MKKTGLIHRIGRATIASGIVFAVSLSLWVNQRIEDEPRLEYPSWPDISWVIVTTTTSTTVPAPTTTEPKPETTKPKRTTTTSSSTPPSTFDPLSPETTTVEAGNPTSTVSSMTTSA